jgi:hypothetical protein
MSDVGTRNQDDRRLLQSIHDQLNTLAVKMEAEQIAEYVDLMNSPRKLITRNILAGIARGVGVAIGLTIFTAVIMYLLRTLGALNLPIVGDFIADLIEMVDSELAGRSYGGW